jgi:hypothetical protein
MMTNLSADKFVDLLLDVTIAAHDVGEWKSSDDTRITLQDLIEIENMAVKRLILYVFPDAEQHANYNEP